MFKHHTSLVSSTAAPHGTAGAVTSSTLRFPASTGAWPEWRTGSQQPGVMACCFLAPLLLLLEWTLYVQPGELAPSLQIWPDFVRMLFLAVPGSFTAGFCLLLLTLNQFPSTPSGNIADWRLLSRMTQHSLLFSLFPALLLVGLLTPNAQPSVALTEPPAPTLTISARDRQLSDIDKFSIPHFVSDSESLNASVLHALVHSSAASLTEEAIFRGLLFFGLTGLLLHFGWSQRSSFAFSLFVSSVAFAWAHEPTWLTVTAPALLVYRFLAGAYLANIAWHYGLGVAVGTHFCFNLALLLAVG